MLFVQWNRTFVHEIYGKVWLLQWTLDQVSGIALPWTCNVFFRQLQMEESGKEGGPKHWISEDVFPLCKFFSISKFYLFMYMLHIISTPLFSRFFNVSIVIFDVMPVEIANTGSCILYNSVVFQFEPTLEWNVNSQPLTFVFWLQARCTTYTFIGPSIFGNGLSLYKNSINDFMIQVIQISVEFKVIGTIDSSVAILEAT